MIEELRRELERWGFSDTEIEVYLAILRMGEGEVTDISDRAGVSDRHVYRICGRLEERELVDVDEHVQPAQVRALPPTVVHDVFGQSYETIAEGVESLYARSPTEYTDIEVLKHQSTVFTRAQNLVDDAERWLILVAPPDVVETLEAELASAVERDLFVLLLTSVDTLSTDRDLADLATVVRTRDSPKGFQEVALGVDKVQSLMVSSSAKMGGTNRYSPAIYLHDETLGVRNNDTLFGIEWRLAREHVVPDPMELPYESSLFRQSAFHAALHSRDGTALRATVEGVLTEDDRSTIVDGEVVEVRQGIVEPYRQSFLGERTLVIETDDGRVTVGGSSATLEDYAADAVTLYTTDEQMTS